MIAVDIEQVFAVNQADKFTSYSPTTVRRWIINGLEGPDGMVHLEKCVTLSGTLGTSIEAIKRFHRRINGLPVEPGEIPKRRKRKRSHAEEEE